MICCPEELVKPTPEKIHPEPRFPVGNDPGGEPRKCTDKTDMCAVWKNNGGCKLDRSFSISDIDRNGEVTSQDMFKFMQTACPESCGWCGSKGCVDEHPNCPSWARDGICVLNPLVMGHTCRESCGVCGFLSPESKEEQVKNGRSYTDFTKDNFECGRYKLFSEMNGEDFGTETEKSIQEIPTEPLVDDDSSTDDFDIRTTDDVFFSSDGDSFCGGTQISDRWVVAAAHCYDDFGSATQVLFNTIRDNTANKESVEIKRVFKHPNYKYPTLYNDIALLELGRRVVYDFDLYGDSPSCMDKGMELEGKLGNIQGKGNTEFGTRGTLLEANLTIISNEDCVEALNYNTTGNSVERNKIDRALPQGLNYGLLCARGEKIKNKNGKIVYRGSCKGDSGGPLTVKDESLRRTLVGIVSGGIGCGKGIPGWYTKLAFHSEWIQCIVRTSKSVTKTVDIKKSCEDSTIKPKKCQEIETEDLIFGDQRSVEDDFCNEDGTFALFV